MLGQKDERTPDSCINPAHSANGFNKSDYHLRQINEYVHSGEIKIFKGKYIFAEQKWFSGNAF